MIFDFSPIPNHKISMGIKASGGVFLINSNKGLKYSYSFLFIPNKIPSGIAIIELIIKPIKILLKLTNTFSYMDPFFIISINVLKTFIGGGRIYSL
ncbi:hypothetical protein SDC9_203040 [bioreactor metagenome]|uniref:Uncharacterized protein n=1 Tax=bioreactor metagenome TaxID=1076179 RepID=A0A645IVB6_9ZZZZ